VTSSGTTRRARRAVALPLAAVLLAVGATAVLARPEDGRFGSGSAVTGTPEDSFSITSAIFSTPSGVYPAETCSGTPALLVPGTERCIVFSVHNASPNAITVSSISTTLGPASAALPAECIGDNLVLPSFVGAVDVPAGGDATTVGVPVQLKDSGTNQDACKNVTYDFVYSGTSVSVSPSNSATTTTLATTPNPSALGGHVSLTATVTPVADVGPVTGTVRFYVGTFITAPRLLGVASVGPDGTATLDVTDLPVGDAVVFAAYDGSRTFGASTSAGVAQTVVGPPTICRGPFTFSAVAAPSTPSWTGTPGNDFLFSSGGTVRVIGLDGNDCIWTASGQEVISAGNGHDIVLSGSGNKTVDGGAGNNRIGLGRGTSRVVAGNGANRVSLGVSTRSLVRLGHGKNVVTLSGTRNTVILGNGRNTVRINGRGGYNTVRTGRGITVVWFGAGTHNTFIGARPGNICHVPRPPRTWRGTPAAYYKDRFVNCRVVTP
jgi:hypothetical protein